jgi:DNA ligase-1
VINYKLGDKLYALTSTGKIKVWWAVVYQHARYSSLILINCTGIDGKEIRREEKFTQGKNIGRSNETTALEQAKLEAESRYRKKLKQGYTTTIPNAGGPLLNELGYLKPMLARSKCLPPKDWKFPLHWQPKLDGHRCMAVGTKTGTVLYSRGGTLITTMDHIAKDLDLKEGEYLDGELYVHGLSLQKITRLIKKYRSGESEQVKYIVYDIPHIDGNFSKRLAIYRAYFIKRAGFSGGLLESETVESWIEEITWEAHVIPIFTRECKTEEEAKLLTKEALRYGFEGAILRNNGMLYRSGARSKDLIKDKPFDDGEWKIIHITEGKRYIMGDTDIPQAIFILELPNGKTFEVAAPGSKIAKSILWRDRNQHIGKMCTVKHSGFTDDGVPWHPIALQIREDI